MSNPTSPGIHLPPPLLHAMGLGAGIWLHRRWPLPLLPDSWRALGVWLGWGLMAAALLLILWAFVTFARAGTSVMPNQPATRLLTSGPFRYSRNPLYLAVTTLYLGLAVFVDTLWPLFFLPLVLLVLDRWIIRAEERYLLAAFGDEYRAYLGRVRRWL